MKLSAPTFLCVYEQPRKTCDPVKSIMEGQWPSPQAESRATCDDSPGICDACVCSAISKQIIGLLHRKSTIPLFSSIGNSPELQIFENQTQHAFASLCTLNVGIVADQALLVTATQPTAPRTFTAPAGSLSPMINLQSGGADSRREDSCILRWLDHSLHRSLHR